MTGGTETFEDIVMAISKPSERKQWLELGTHSRARAILIAELAERNASIGTKNKIDLKYRMAATDSFVEKAIIHLSARAFQYTAFGSGAAILFILLLLSATTLAYYANPIRDLSAIDIVKSGHWPAIGYLTSRLTLTGFIVAGLYATFSFAVSFFDESLKAYGRRHSMRWARLYLWLSHGEVEASVLAEHFGVAYDGKTAFSRVKPEMVTRGWLSHISDLATGNRKKIEELEELIKELKSAGAQR